MSTTPLPGGRPSRSTSRGWLLPVVLMLACFAVYANAIPGAFVYDDKRLIVDNPLIQESRHYWKALTSDVWAFKGDAAEAWSNYWRPTFTLWQILNFRLFGLDNPAGWHLGSILLHALVTALGFGFLRFLGLGKGIAGTVALIFAVHPVHVESVAWIAGSADLLMASTFVGALWLALSAIRRCDWRGHALALPLYALALGAKEAAIVFPLVLFIGVVLSDSTAGRPWMSRIVRAARLTAPYVLLAAIYFLVRLMILGQVAKDDATDVSLLTTAFTAPELTAFYLRQAFFPVVLGPSYPLRAFDPSSLGSIAYWIAVMVFAVAATVFTWAVCKDPVRRIGALLFALVLLPAYHIDAFVPEQIVHDRYLYLPLLGLFMVLVPSLAAIGGRLSRAAGPWKRALGYGLAGLWCLLLAYQTTRYNPVWHNDLDLWARGVAVDPGSEFNWTQYAYALAEAGRNEEAGLALERGLGSMTSSSTPHALLKRAEIAIDDGRLADAVNDLNTVLLGQPQNVEAYERLAVVFQMTGQLDQAASILVAGRERIPRHECEFSTNLAVVFYLGGARDRALSELERIRPQALQTIIPGCRLALFRLGQLYVELGRVDEGRAALRDYLANTEGMRDETTLRYRELARRELSK